MYRIDMDGSNPTHLFGLGRAGDFAVSDDYIFFQDSGLKRRDIDGNNQITFTDSADLCYSFFVMNGWVYYSGGVYNGEFGVYKVKVDKTGHEQVFKYDDGCYGMVSGGYGNWIHFDNVNYKAHEPSFWTEGVYRIGLDGTETTKIYPA